MNYVSSSPSLVIGSLFVTLSFLVSSQTTRAEPGSSAAPAAPAPLPADDETTIRPDAVAHRDLVYISRKSKTGDIIDIKLDLFVPPGEGPFPLIIWIHGGGRHLLTKRDWPHMMFALKHGFAVANIDYRLSQVATWPAQIDDCAAALDFLAMNSAKYHLDPQRIVAAGESAGGHLAALLAMHRTGTSRAGDAKSDDVKTDPSHGTIRAAIDFFGPTDLFSLYSANPDLAGAVTQLIDGPPDQHRDLAKSASPIMQIDRSAPPMLIFHGTNDPLVPIAQSESFAAALKRAGIETEFQVIEGAGHGGPQFWTPMMQEKLIAFISRTTASKAAR